MRFAGSADGRDKGREDSLSSTREEAVAQMGKVRRSNHRELTGEFSSEVP